MSLVLQTVREFDGGDEGVSCLALSPDGKLMVSGSLDGSLKVWDLLSGEQVRRFSGHSAGVACVDISPDGRLAVSGCRDSTVQVCDLASGRLVRTLEGHGPAVQCLSIALNGRSAVVGNSDGTLAIWDLQSFRELGSWQAHRAPASWVAIAPDGSTLVSGASDGIVFWNFESKVVLQPALRIQKAASCAAIAAGGKYLATGSLDGSLTVWDLVTARELWAVERLPNPVTCVGITPSGRHVISGSDKGLLEVWDVKAGTRDVTEAPRVTAIDGRLLASRLVAYTTGPTVRLARMEASSHEAVIAPSPSLDTESLPVVRLDENVQFTVFRPRVVAPEKWVPLLAFAHLSSRRPDAPADEPDPLEEVQAQAAQFLGASLDAYGALTLDSSDAIPASGEMTFVPEVPGIEFNPPRATFLWLESVHRHEFRLRAARSLDGQTARGRLTVFLGMRIVADVPLAIQVSSRAELSETPEKPVAESARPYRRIFASYSHRDVEVVEEFERLAEALGDEYLRDSRSLRSGEVWSDQLSNLIRQADVFQLFWSHASMRSAFVRTEWEHALSLSRPHFVRPVFWQDPMPEDATAGLPPENLRSLHFHRLPAISRSSPPGQYDSSPEEPVLRELVRETPPALACPPAPSFPTNEMTTEARYSPYWPPGSSEISKKEQQRSDLSTLALALFALTVLTIFCAAVMLLPFGSRSPGSALAGGQDNPLTFSADGPNVKMSYQQTGNETLIVSSGINGKELERFEANASTPAHLFVNKLAATALFKIQILGATDSSLLAIAGSGTPPPAVGQGTITEFAVALAGRYHVPVLLHVTETQTRLTWNLASKDPVRSASQALEGMQYVVDEKERGLVSILDR